jgi:hypothetical protein
MLKEIVMIIYRYSRYAMDGFAHNHADEPDVESQELNG